MMLQSKASTDSTKIFSKTTDYYDKFRPTYPRELFDLLAAEYQINSSKIVADIGSGTGIFSKHLLDRSYRVISVEPNDDMRKIAESKLSKYREFTSVSATAEVTTIESNSIDIITVATAFHWFNPELTKKEFKRILKTNGWCFLVWNIRNNAIPIMQDYDSMMREHIDDYDKVVKNTNFAADDMIIDFFKPNNVQINQFKNVQSLNLEGLKGRVLSVSYSPKFGDEKYAALMAATEKLFDKYKTSGQVELHYQCKCYVGQL